MANPDELLTAPEVGQIIGLSGRTVLRRYESMGIPLVQKLPGINGARLFRRGDVDAYLEREREREREQVAS